MTEINGISEPVERLAPVSANVLAGPSDGVEIKIFKISNNTLRPFPARTVFPVEHIHIVRIAKIGVIKMIQSERYEWFARRIYERPIP